MRKVEFGNGNFYHIYNRGVDKRDVFLSQDDHMRFLESMAEFNTTEPVGGIFAASFHTQRKRPVSPLVNIVCYCLNPNHFHLILEQLVSGGISEFTRRLGGYTKYFNCKYKRNGVLFQGPFQSSLIDSNDYLLYVSAYVNLNFKVHRLRHGMSKSSWDEYVGKEKAAFCKKDIILDQFKSAREYEEFAEEALASILERKDLEKELKAMLLE